MSKEEHFGIQCLHGVTIVSRAEFRRGLIMLIVMIAVIGLVAGTWLGVMLCNFL